MVIPLQVYAMRYIKYRNQRPFFIEVNFKVSSSLLIPTNKDMSLNNYPMEWNIKHFKRLMSRLTVYIKVIGICNSLAQY